MKRTISCILIAIIFASILPLKGFAVNTEVTNITYFDDGSYMTETIYTFQTRASGTITGSKEKNFYGSDGVLEWKAILTGTFGYTGTNSVCTASSCNITIYDSAWYTISKSATKSGNTAYASVTMGEKRLGVTVNQVPASITLTCDKNGNLS